jgi:nitrile hydratase
MQDFEMHVKALEADIEYWRCKRMEPRVLHYVRRNILPLHMLFKAAAAAGLPDGANGHVDDHDDDEHEEGEAHQHEPLERRIRALEDRLDDYVRGIALAMTEPGTADFVIDDSRKESGAYDSFFRFTKRAHGGTMEERLQQLDRELNYNQYVLDTFTRALMSVGLLDEKKMEQRRKQAAARKEGWNGARIVARPWVDPEFKKRLLENGREAVRELDIPPGRLAKLGVAENTDTSHNGVVCTLCSCYPNELLGSPPWWYRHDSYKQQIVQDPRSVLADMFGLEVSEQKSINVHDSTSDLRWFVLPQRPAGTEGWSEEELARLVTIESLVGVSVPMPGSQDGR